MKVDLDIVIPAYFEGESIIFLLDSLEKEVESIFKVYICYDLEEDDTLTSIKNHRPYSFEIILVKNKWEGLHGAVLSGFERTSAALAGLLLPFLSVLTNPFIKVSGYRFGP